MGNSMPAFLLRSTLLCTLLFTAMMITGCGETSSTASSESASSDGSQAVQTPQASDAVSEQAEADASNWKLVFGQMMGLEIYEIHSLLFENPADASGEELNVLSNLANWSVQSYAIKDDSIELKLTQDSFPLVFEGKKNGGVYYGSISSPAEPSVLLPARLVPSSSKELSQNELQQPPAGALELQKLTQQPTGPEGFRNLLKQYPNSMIALAVHPVVMQRLTKPEEILEALKAYGDALSLYGKKYALLKLPEATLGMTAKGVDAEVVQQAVAYVREKAGDELTEDARTSLETAEAIAKAQSDQEEFVTQGMMKLEELTEADPFNPIIAVTLGEALMKKGETDKAFDYFSRLVALPSLLQPATMFAAKGNMDHLSPLDHVRKIWTDKHGSLEGLQEHLNKVYEDQVTWFAEAAKIEDVDGHRQHVLIELYTGATCPPCVAADIALSGIEKSYPADLVTILRYHMHIPGPDPMVSPSGHARFNAYGLQSTPTTLINGRLAPPMGGDISMSTDLYENLSGIMESATKKTSTVKLDISAKAEGPEVTINTTVEGVPEDRLEELVLSAVIAEDKIYFPTQNGIRVHDMLVRAVLAPQPFVEKDETETATESEEQTAASDEEAAAKAETAAESEEPEEVKLSAARDFQWTTNLEDIEADIITGLSEIGKQAQHRFTAVPLEMEELSVIVFVQSKKDGEILQSTVTKMSRTAAPAVTKRKKADKAEEKPAKVETETKPETQKSSETPETKPETEKEEAKPEAE